MIAAPWTVDPRPDLGDSDRWARVFAAAAASSGSGYASAVGWLRGMRALGCTLRAKADGTTGLELPPDLDRAAMARELGGDGGTVRQALASVD